jgi:hypothetical protein
MSFVKFCDWIIARESSPATRLRNASALGLMPPIPSASINSHSTAPEWQQKKLLAKKKRRKKRKSGKKKGDNAPQNKSIDVFVRSVEELEKDLKRLGAINGSKRQKAEDNKQKKDNSPIKNKDLDGDKESEKKDPSKKEEIRSKKSKNKT